MSRYIKIAGELFVRSTIAHCLKIEGYTPKLRVVYCSMGGLVPRSPYWDYTDIKFDLPQQRDRCYEKVQKIAAENTEEL
jgi:hypothetical protein